MTYNEFQFEMHRMWARIGRTEEDRVVAHILNVPFDAVNGYLTYHDVFHTHRVKFEAMPIEEFRAKIMLLTS